MTGHSRAAQPRLWVFSVQVLSSLSFVTLSRHCSLVFVSFCNSWLRPPLLICTSFLSPVIGFTCVSLFRFFLVLLPRCFSLFRLVRPFCGLPGFELD